MGGGIRSLRYGRTRSDRRPVFTTVYGHDVPAMLMTTTATTRSVRYAHPTSTSATPLPYPQKIFPVPNASAPQRNSKTAELDTQHILSSPNQASFIRPPLKRAAQAHHLRPPPHPPILTAGVSFTPHFPPNLPQIEPAARYNHHQCHSVSWTCVAAFRVPARRLRAKLKCHVNVAPLGRWRYLLCTAYNLRATRWDGNSGFVPAIPSAMAPRTAIT